MDLRRGLRWALVALALMPAFAPGQALAAPQWLAAEPLDTAPAPARPRTSRPTPTATRSRCGSTEDGESRPPTARAAGPGTPADGPRSRTSDDLERRCRASWPCPTASSSRSGSPTAAEDPGAALRDPLGPRRVDGPRTVTRPAPAAPAIDALRGERGWQRHRRLPGGRRLGLEHQAAGERRPGVRTRGRPADPDPRPRGGPDGSAVARRPRLLQRVRAACARRTGRRVATGAEPETVGASPPAR